MSHDGPKMKVLLIILPDDSNYPKSGATTAP